MSIKKANIDEVQPDTSGPSKEEQIKNLKSTIDSRIKANELAKRELDLRVEITELQKKKPKVMTPSFEFESTPAWEELLKQQWQLELDKVCIQICDAIKLNEETITKCKDEIEKMEGESK